MPKILQIVFSVSYAAMLSAIYVLELLSFWRYMGFQGQYSHTSLALTLASSALIALVTPNNYDVRSVILTCLNFLFFIPSVVLVFFSGASSSYIISLLIVFLSIYSISAFKIPAFRIQGINHKGLIIFVSFAIVMMLGLQIVYGGLDYFSLDFERVYEFRTVAADELPGIFGYVYSNIANVLLPFALIYAIDKKMKYTTIFVIGCFVLLFGMSHHKSVMFGMALVFCLYALFSRTNKYYYIGCLFLVVPTIAIIDIFITRYVDHSFGPSYMASVLVRRALFSAPLLDTMYTEFFSVYPKFYWSASKFGSWLSDNPYGMSAPEVIGIEYLNGTVDFANAGIISSGYSNAGLFGVALYSIIVGFIISILNSYGKIIGVAFVSSVSLLTISYVVTTTDLATALLTHGLVLLICVLAACPPMRRADRKAD